MTGVGPVRSMLSTFLILVACANSRASIFFDQQPLNTGGPDSDTAYITSGQSYWQRVADDVQLTNSATLNRIMFWGFYGGQFDRVEPPPTEEVMRLRFYDARPGDGLPGA